LGEPPGSWSSMTPEASACFPKETLNPGLHPGKTLTLSKTVLDFDCYREPLHSRYVVSWELADSMDLAFVLTAVERGLARSQPEILNSDQGSQFTSPAYLNLVEGAGVLISMDGRGRALDNVFTERLWRTLKYEEVYVRDYDGPRDARQSIGAYLAFYNDERPHQALGYRTPAEAYRLPTAEAAED
jgi:transposase InsO family protein